jgi:hypothetical protein
MLTGLALTWIALGQWLEVRTIGNGLSRVADPWTEADTLRAGEGYARLGFRANWALPDLCFGDQFAERGTEGLLRQQSGQYTTWQAGALAHRPEAGSIGADRFVYTHYPPGPHWIAGILTSVLGPGRVAMFRIVPVMIGLIAFSYLAYELARYSGTLAAAAVLLILVALPMSTNMMHGLSYQGYALALLIVEVGLCLRLGYGTTPTRGSSVALFLVGFFQGWLGFDYFFLVTFTPLAVWLAYRQRSMPWRMPMLAGAAAAAGFTFAHLLHFAQVALYLGDLQAAIRDFTEVARYRSAGETLDTGEPRPSPAAVLWNYLTVRTASPLHMNVSLLVLLGVALGLWPILRRLQPERASGAPLLAIPFALAVSSLWLLAMPQHAAQHWHFIPRHYFLTVLVTLLALLPRRRISRAA